MTVRGASALLAGLAAVGWGQGVPQPVRWQAQYTQIYSDDIESMGPTLTPAFSLSSAGSLTSDPAEVIAGMESIKGSYSGTNAFVLFLQTIPSILPLTPNHPYQVTFQYKILTAAANGFQVFLNSSTALSQGVGGIAGITINGAAGKQGTATFTATPGSYADYAVLWGINGAGAISVDNIQISDAATGKVIASENADGTTPTLKSGIQFTQGATVVTNPTEVISGKASLLLANQGGFTTNSSVLPLAGNTVYTIKFDYRILSRGSNDALFFIWFQPTGTTDFHLQITPPAMLKNQEATGTFSTGAQTAGAASYTLNLSVFPGVSLTIDNIFVYRQDPISQNVTPPSWGRLLTMPYPRLGNKILEGTTKMAQAGWDEPPFTYTVSQIESGLAFADLVVGLSTTNQTLDPDSIHRIRTLNPNIVILPSRDVISQQIPQSPPYGSNINLDYQLLQSTPDQWKATDTSGNLLHPVNYPDLFYMNLSEFVPAVNGETWRTALPNFVTTKIFPSGLWDGVWLSNLQGTLDPGFPNANNPALFNYDWNGNGLRDETPASTSDMIRPATVGVLQQVNSSTGGMQLTIGNGGIELALAPLVNGYSFECFNVAWNHPGTSVTSGSPASWRAVFDAYLRMQGTSRSPQLNVLQACGASASDLNTENRTSYYVAPTLDDLLKHRLSMGTALLGNGFYEYALKDDLSAPYWFDEYSVDSSGNAIKDFAKKGYLGHPLSDAVEPASPGTLVFQEGFDSALVPNSFIGYPSSGVSITQTPSEVISGTGSLVLSNPDHTEQGLVAVNTNPAVVPLSAGLTYLLTFDWRILETTDWPSGFGASVSNGSQSLDALAIPNGTVAGDSGTLRFPFTVPSAGSWRVGFGINNGGGKVVVDNVKIFQGGVGPWRRDFENGFVLVNPFQQPHTFSAADLAGALSRTGIKRINGTQAPDVNNGQPVTSDLTIGAFDSIILLADRIAVATPVILGAATSGGAPSIAQNGWIEINGINLAPTGVGPGGTIWDRAPSFESGIMPTELGGVRVTVNGKPAFVYYASANQVNVLSPLDNTTGAVEIVVTSGGVSSAPFPANLQAAAPSFPLLRGTSYVVATHADYSLVGPASLSVPGYTFTPARSGETIIIYAFGLGLPTTTIVNGASTQAGTLPTLPQVQIGGATATVTFAGVISPGLYQLNVIIPGNARSGDNKLILTYGGQASPTGDLIAIR